MIIEVTRGHIKVQLAGKTITIPGEMFFPSNERLGFAISMRDIKSWDCPHDAMPLTRTEVDEVLEEIRMDFAKGGHILEVD